MKKGRGEKEGKAGERKGRSTGGIDVRHIFVKTPTDLACYHFNLQPALSQRIPLHLHTQTLGSQVCTSTGNSHILCFRASPSLPPWDCTEQLPSLQHVSSHYFTHTTDGHMPLYECVHQGSSFQCGAVNLRDLPDVGLVGSNEMVGAQVWCPEPRGTLRGGPGGWR